MTCSACIKESREKVRVHCNYSCIKYANVSLLITIMDMFWINFILGSIFYFPLFLYMVLNV